MMTGRALFNSPAERDDRCSRVKDTNLVGQEGVVLPPGRYRLRARSGGPLRDLEPALSRTWRGIRGSGRAWCWRRLHSRKQTRCPKRQHGREGPRAAVLRRLHDCWQFTWPCDHSAEPMSQAAPKVRQRIRQLHALIGSPNENEAGNARRILAALLAEYGLTWNDLPAVLAEVINARSADIVIAPVARSAAPTIAETGIGGDSRADAIIPTITRFTRPINYLGLPALAGH